MIYKFFLAMGLLILMLAGCLLVSGRIDSAISAVVQDVDTAIEQAGNGQLEQAAHSLHEARIQWQAQRSMFASVSNHTPMDDIDEVLAETESYGFSFCKDAFLAGCAKLKTLLDSISQDHRLTWWNFL